MDRGLFDIDVHPFVPHKGPPDPGEHHQLYGDGDSKVAGKAVLKGFHALRDIKMRAIRMGGQSVL